MYFTAAWPKMLEELPVPVRAQFTAEQTLVDITSGLKGSFEALMCPDGHVPDPEASSRGPTKSDEATLKRRHLHTLFRAYEHFKAQHRLFDHLDVVHHVYRRWLLEGHQQRSVHG